MFLLGWNGLNFRSLTLNLFGENAKLGWKRVDGYRGSATSVRLWSVKKWGFDVLMEPILELDSVLF